MGGTIGTTLKKLRTEKQWTMMQVAQMLGVSLGAYQKYENNTHDVGTETLCKLADLYNVTTDYLLGRAPQTDPMKLLVAQSDLSPEAQEEIYMSLPQEAQAIVLTVMRMLRARRQPAQEKPQTVWIKLHQSKAAAGFGYDLSDKDEWEEIEVLDTAKTASADFAVEVEGDSMLPDFRDGDIVLIKLDPDVPIGEVGLFVHEGKGYIKECGKKKLISRNPAYPDIEGESRCIGLVIGIAELA